MLTPEGRGVQDALFVRRKEKEKLVRRIGSSAL